MSEQETININVLVLGTDQNGEKCFWIIAVEVPNQYSQSLSTEDNDHLLAAMLEVEGMYGGEPVMALDATDSCWAALTCGQAVESVTNMDRVRSLNTEERCRLRASLVINAMMHIGASELEISTKSIRTDNTDDAVNSIFRCLTKLNTRSAVADMVQLLVEVEADTSLPIELRAKSAKLLTVLSL